MRRLPGCVHPDHSLRRLVTGLFNAELTDWNPTVIAVMTSARTGRRNKYQRTDGDPVIIPSEPLMKKIIGHRRRDQRS